jgi:hypothetical protein
MIRFPAKRAAIASSPEASKGSAATRSTVQCSASITVLPVTWIVSGAIVSRRSALAAVSVGAKCSAAIGATIRRFTSSGQGW